MHGPDPEHVLHEMEADHAFLEAHIAEGLRQGQTREIALIDATYALRAARGRDYRKKLLQSPLVSPERKAVIQAELLSEGEDVQGWLEAAEVRQALAERLEYDQALRDRKASDTLAFPRGLHRRHQSN